MIKFCAKCVMPDTRPDLSFDEAGVCAACRSIERKKQVDWEQRAADWANLVAWAKDRGVHSQYDCIAAVSGGKDSHFIVYQCIGAGLRTLGVSFEPSSMTPIGQQNLDNLTNFCDVIQVKKRRDVYRALRLAGFRNVGDSEWPNHVGIFTSVTRAAVEKGIPLILWGENPQTEYAPPNEASQAHGLDRKWFEEFGGLLGLRVKDVGGQNLSEYDLVPYIWPPAERVKELGLRSVFLGNYFFWDSVSLGIGMCDKMGFNGTGGSSYWPFENIDDRCAVVWHDFLGLLKYGYSRAQAQLSIEIRHGYSSRAAALDTLLRGNWDAYPSAKDEKQFAGELGIAIEEVRKVCTAYVNRDIWQGEDVTKLERRVPIL